MACAKEHKSTDRIVKDLPISQGSFERHKCASCAYEMGFKNGNEKVLNFDLKLFISELPESQKGLRRHRSATEAYTLGFFHGLNGENHIAIKDKLRMASQMRDFGLYTVAKGVVNCTFSENGNPYAHAMGLVQVANGFEVLIKSKIVEEHPLLIFSKIPKNAHISDGDMKVSDLLEHGQTIMYSDLPDRLWATTGYKLKNLELFKRFGKLRNQIIHFSIPEEANSDIVLKYTFEVVENAINDWWDTTILEYAMDYDDEYCLYAFEQMERLKIKSNYKLDKNNYPIKK